VYRVRLLAGQVMTSGEEDDDDDEDDDDGSGRGEVACAAGSAAAVVLLAVVEVLGRWLVDGTFGFVFVAGGLGWKACG
jgi:hypothetical protein